MKGSLQPFAGWEVVDGIPVPVPALIMEQAGQESWDGVVWQLNDAADEGIQLAGFPQFIWGKEATDWSAHLPTKNGDVEISRHADSISLSSPGNPGSISPVRINLSVESDTEEKVSRIRSNFVEVSEKYPTVVPLGYRWKISWALLTGFFVQELFIFRPLKARKNILRYARTVTVCVWAIGAVLIAFFFNQTVDLLTRII